MRNPKRALDTKMMHSYACVSDKEEMAIAYLTTFGKDALCGVSL